MNENQAPPEKEIRPPSAPTVAETEDSPAKRPDRPDPTRYNDWEKGGRCIDF